ncbi:MAG TPA: winged helix-turn-helix domain-containing protein [Terriglobia bacterium]|nr:winged helix-turn-helix domain-containing protein [Terriglobia bacterium]
MENPRKSGIVRFGVFELDLNAGELRRNGSKIRLQEQPFQILSLLLEHPGEMVTQEQVIAKLWPDGTIVEFEHSIRTAVRKLRHALDDDADRPRYVETLPRRGYRFLYPVNGFDVSPGIEETTSGDEVWKRSRWFRWTAAGIAFALLSAATLFTFNIFSVRDRFLGGTGAPQIQSLAVLPLVNLSGDPMQEYFADGMTDALITELAQVGSIRVISRTSSMQYKQTKKSLPEIARELRVDGIVEGTVQRSGDRVRITAQLIQGSSDKHLWAKSYERDTRDTFALERDMAEEIAGQVQAGLPTLTHALLAEPRPVNPIALEAFLQGNYSLTRFGRGAGDKAPRKAGEYFQKAIDTDPNFAQAYVGLFKAHYGVFWPSKNDADIATASAERAVQLDPNLADARAILGKVKASRDWDFHGAEQEYRRAIALSPNNANAHTDLCALLFFMGRREEGLRECQISQQLDPTGDPMRDVDSLYWAGEEDRAIALAQKLAQADPGEGYIHHALYRYYARKGMYREASREMGRVLDLFGDPDGAERVVRALSSSGGRAGLRQSARELQRWMTTKRGYCPGNLAAVYAILGDKNRAFYWLEEQYKHHDLGWLTMDVPLEGLKSEHMFDSLRSDPRYKDLLRRVGLPP